MRGCETSGKKEERDEKRVWDDENLPVLFFGWLNESVEGVDENITKEEVRAVQAIIFSAASRYF